MGLELGFIVQILNEKIGKGNKMEIQTAQIQDTAGNLLTSAEVKEWLVKTLNESKSEMDVRERCRQKFGDSLSDLRLSVGANVKIANIYLKGQVAPIYAVVS